MTTDKRVEPFRRVCDAIWRIITSSESLVCLLVIGALGCLVVGCVPQVPSAAVNDNVQSELWLNSVTSPWYGSISAWHVAGFTRLAHSRLVLLYFMVLFIVCALHTLAAFIPAWCYPGNLSKLDIEFPAPADVWRVIISAADQAGMSLHQQQMPISTPSKTQYRSASNLRKTRWFWLALVCSMLLLFTVIMSTIYTNNHELVRVSPGETVKISSAASHSLVLDQLTMPAGGTSAVTSTWRLAGSDRQLTLEQGKPVNYAHHTLFLIGQGPALQLAIKDSTGQTVDIVQNNGDGTRLQTASFYFSQTEQEQIVTLPDVNLVLRIVNDPSESLQTTGRAAAFQIYQADTSDLLYQTILEDSSAVAFQDIIFKVTLVDYVTLRLQSSIWGWLAAVGLLLLAIGIIGIACVPQCQVWFAVDQRADDAVCFIWFRKTDANCEWLQQLQMQIRGAVDASQ
ncbi:MAG: hypothetical protein LLG44_10495 [Chloroflexi bacterium]|nr:hypothetical protein [Chloroflexota bacterium]